MKKLSKVIMILIIMLLVIFNGCFEFNSKIKISDIEIIDYTITAQKHVKEGCCYKNITIDIGFNYSPDVQSYVINGTVLNKNDIQIKKLKITGVFYDIENNDLISRTDYVSNLSYLSEKNFKIIVEDHYSFKEFNKINYVKFEFEIL